MPSKISKRRDLPDPSQTSKEDQLVHAMESYRVAMDSGNAPPREEFLSQYPDIAGDLASVLDGLDFVREVAPQLSEGGRPPGAPIAETRIALGDFHIVRQLGRGGMGVVYEAKQLSLGRSVALKVLPFAAMMDDRQLQRFKNEARAAATLDHPNIVSVHAIGSERGVHFYAMQLVEGQSMAEVIEELRELNEIVEPDVARVSDIAKSVLTGEPVSADGVRSSGSDPTIDHTSDRDPEANPSLSSPDTTSRRPQAAISTDTSTRDPVFFRRVARLGIQAAEALDHAHTLGILHRDIKPANLMLDANGNLLITDFGLARIESDAGMTMSGDLVGTIRYMAPEQALAKRVAVDSRADIYSLGITLYELATLRPAYAGEDRETLLKKIAFEEPPHPRQVSSTIPSELATIVLKAMRKNPDERYPTALELAEDLQRFVADEPIKAKPPTPVERLGKWARRHKTATRAAMLVGVIAMFGLLTSLYLLSREKGRTQAALKTSQDNLAESEKQKDRAETAVELARGIVDDVYLKEAVQLQKIPHMTQAQKQFLVKAAAFYEGLPPEDSFDPEIRYGSAITKVRLGDTYRQLGNHKEATESYRSAITTLEALAGEVPAKFQVQEELASVYQGLGRSFEDIGDKDRASTLFRRVLEISSKLTAEHPENLTYSVDLVRAHSSLAQTLTGEEAETHFNAAESLCRKLILKHPHEPKYRHRLAMVLVRYGDSLTDYTKAVAANREAYKLARDVHNEVSDDYGYRADLASVSLSLCQLLMVRGNKPKAAEPFCRESLDHIVAVADHFPDIVSYQYDRAALQLTLARILDATGRRDAAEKEYLVTIRLFQRLTEKYPDVVRYSSSLAITETSVALLLVNSGRPGRAERHSQNAMDIFQELENLFPGRYRDDVAHSQMMLGHAAKMRGLMNPAEHFYRSAIATAENDVQKESERSLAIQSICYKSLATQTTDAGKLAELYRKAAEISEKLVGIDPSPSNRLELARSYTELTSHVGSREERISALEKSIEIYRGLVSDSPEWVDGKRLLAQRLNIHGWALLESAHLEEQKLAEAPLREAIGLAEQILSETARDWHTVGTVSESVEHLYRCAELTGGYAKFNVTAKRLLNLLPLNADTCAIALHLAISLHQAGYTSEAHEWYGRAVGEMAARNGFHAPFDKVRAQADKLFGKRSVYGQLVEVTDEHVVDGDGIPVSIRAGLARGLSDHGVIDEACEAIDLEMRDPERLSELTRRGIELCEGNLLRLFDFAPLLLLTGDIEGYHGFCLKLDEQANDMPATSLNMVVRMMALSPEILDVIDVGRLLELARRSLASDPAKPWELSSLAMAQYRAGRYEDALKNLPGNANDAAARSLVLYALGRDEGAKQELAVAKRWMANLTRNDHPHAVSACAVFVREVERLLSSNRQPVDEQ